MTSLGEAVVEVGADTSQFRSQTKAGVQSAVKQANGTVSKLGSSLARVGRRVALAGTAGLIGIVTQAVKTQAAYETTMKTLQVSSGASEKDMAKLTEQAKKLGAETVFSAGEAADAMLELGKSGFNASQILQSVPEVMNLAATEGIALDRAAGIVTSSLAQFNLQAKDSSVVVNALAGAATASRSSVEGIGESLKLVGSAAKGIGLSVPETTAALAALSQAGLDGSVAGTSLASVFNHLVPQTTKAKDAMKELNLDFTDAQGNFDDIDVIAEKLSRTFGDMDQESRKVNIAKIFGNDASSIAAVNALISSGAEGLRKFTKASQDNNAAQKLADARMSGTAGAIERLKGAFETAALTLGEKLAPSITKAANFIGDNLVPAMETAIDAGQDILHALEPAFEEISEALGHMAGEGDAVSSFFSGTFIPVLETTAKVVGAVVNFIDELPGPVKEVGAQVIFAAAAFSKLNPILTSVSGSIASQIASFKQMTAEMTYAETRAQRTAAAMSRLQSAAKTAAGVGGLLAIVHGAQQSNETLGLLETTAGGAALGFSVGGPWGAAIGAVGGLATSLLTSKDAAEDMQTATENIDFQQARDDAQQYIDTLDDLTGAFTRTTREMLIFDLRNTGGQFNKTEEDVSGLALELDTAGISMNTWSRAILGNKDALKVVEGQIESTRDRYGNLPAGIKNLQRAFREQTRGLAANRDEWKSQESALQSFKSIQDEVRPKIFTQLTQIGVDSSIEELALFQNKMDLIPKEQKAVFNLLFPEKNDQQIQNMIDRINAIDATIDKLPKDVRTRFQEQGLVPNARNAVKLIAAYGDIRQNFKSLKTFVSTPGIELSRRAVLKLKRQYDLTPKQVRTLFRLEGLPQAVRDSGRGGKQTRKNLEEPGKAKPNLRGWVQGIQTATDQGARFTEKESRTIIQKLESIKKAKPNLAPYVGFVESGVRQATGEAKKSTQVGNELKQGLLSGMAGTGAALSAIMAGAVRQAIAAARAAANSHSPSKETWAIGSDMGIGMTLGYEEEADTLAKAATDSVEKANKDAEEEAGKGGDAAGKAFATKFKEAIKTRADFAREIKSSLLGEFSLDDSAFGGVEGLTGDISGLAARFRKFARQIKKLSKAGLPPGLINQVVGLGSERGSEVAAMLLDATKGERNKLSNAFRSLNRSAGIVGTATGVAVKGTNKEIASDVRAILNEIRKHKREREQNHHGNGNGNGNHQGNGNGHQNDRVVVNNNYYGPQSGRERVRELEWSLRYGSKATRNFGPEEKLA